MVEGVKKREEEIKGFVPKKDRVYKVKAGPIKDFLLEKLYEKDPNLEEVTLNLTRLEKLTVEPRKGLNTDKLLQLLAQEHSVFKNLGSRVMNLLGNMYLKGYITYPRTENDSYGNYKEELEKVSKLYSQKTGILAKVPSLKSDSSVKDHAPISPLVTQSEDPLEDRVLTTLYRHLKKVFSGSNTYEKRIYETKELSYTLLKPLEVNFPDGKTSYDLPDGNLLVSLKLEERTTKPPVPHSLVTLLGQMKKEGVGTKSTRAVIMQKLIKDQYLYLKENKLYTTFKAEKLIGFWRDHEPLILSSNLTKEIETELVKIKDLEGLKKVEGFYVGKLEKLVSQEH